MKGNGYHKTSKLHIPDWLVKKREGNKSLAEAWITDTIKPDHEAGLSDNSFVLSPERQIPNELRLRLNSRGIRVYNGAGNVFLVDITGDRPRIIQRRPLAQRYIELFEGGA